MSNLAKCSPVDTCGLMGKKNVTRSKIREKIKKIKEVNVIAKL